MSLISLIVAFDENRLIGDADRLPWRLPDDMKWFVDKTLGKPVVMGRKTYDSIPIRFKPLRDRHNIIITRNRSYQAAGVTIVHSLPAALAVAGAVPEVIIGGGAEIYRLSLPQANRLYLTKVAGTFSGDVYFPEFEPGEWHVSFRRQHPADERHAVAFTWLILDRIRLRS